MKSLQSIFEGILDADLDSHEFANSASDVVKDFSINGEKTANPTLLKKMNTWIDVANVPVDPMFNHRRFKPYKSSNSSYKDWDDVFKFWSWILSQPMAMFEDKYNGSYGLADKFRESCLTKRGAKKEWEFSVGCGNPRAFSDVDRGIRVELKVWDGGKWKSVVGATMYKTKSPYYDE